MASISIETKKFADLTEILEIGDDGLLLVHDGNGVKTITVENFKADLKALIDANADLLAKLSSKNAGAHNSIYRGKALGSSVTADQNAAISAGTFDDLYIGDYWTIGGVNYRIAAFDYYLNCGDIACNTHHVVIVPDTCLYNHVMNDTNVTTGGYTGSKMYTEGLANAKTTIKNAFGASHILSHRSYLTNAVTNGHPSAGAWFGSEIELMNENNVYGGKMFTGVTCGTNVPALYTIDKGQFPLFALEPSRITNGANYWLRDVVSASTFAYVYSGGMAHANSTSLSLGVRPAFSIKS